MLTSLSRLKFIFFLIPENKFLELQESRAVISNTCHSMPVVIDSMPVRTLRHCKWLGSWPGCVNAVTVACLHE